MREFLIMIGELFFISCLQSVLDMLVADKKKTYMNKVIAIACYIGSLSIVLRFTFETVFQELLSFFHF